MLSLLEFSSDTNPNWPVVVAFLGLSGVGGQKTLSGWGLNLVVTKKSE